MKHRRKIDAELNKMLIDAANALKENIIDLKTYNTISEQINKARRYNMLSSKLRWINWVMLFAWIISMAAVGWEMSGTASLGQIVGMVVNCLALLIPIAFLVEQFAIYRSFKVNVDSNELLKIVSHGFDKNGEKKE